MISSLYDIHRKSAVIPVLLGLELVAASRYNLRDKNDSQVRNARGDWTLLIRVARH